MNAKIRVLAEASMLVALATVLSMLKAYEMPYGGSVTLASALPIALIGYRHGVWQGLFAGLVYGAVQLLLGLSTLSYFTTPLSIVAVILLDYIVAFAAYGLGGVFRRVARTQTGALVAGAGLVSLLRYVCHTVSGATVWAGLSIPSEAALLYSLSYNATYMIPETILLIAVAVYLSPALDFSTRIPTPRKREGDGARGFSYSYAMLPIIAAVIADTLLVFPVLQDPSGEFSILRLSLVNWWLVGGVTLGLLAVAGGIFLLLRARAKRASA